MSNVAKKNILQTFTLSPSLEEKDCIVEMLALLMSVNASRSMFDDSLSYVNLSDHLEWPIEKFSHQWCYLQYGEADMMRNREKIIKFP
uniref:Uncharacterized protein n=1 Tax=Romanomermis culicivorax TaxID=13658 RepID=A0A915KKD5_ROMCU